MTANKHNLQESDLRKSTPFIRVNSLNVTNDHDFYVITVWFDDCFIHVPNISGLLGLSHGLIHILENTR